MLLAGLFKATAGYSLSTVFDHETAVELCIAGLPDHAIIDSATSGIDGISLAKRLRTIEPQRTMRIVTVAPRGSTPTTHDAIDLEVHHPATVTEKANRRTRSSRLARPSVPE
ncbi:MAG: hypothetical protein QM736_14650 [Vicinamibacterales bacterium]